jgi:alginate O-acetyltransferase complex protein AlgI
MFFIPSYIFILFITISIDYLAGIYIEKSTGSRKKVYLVISIVSTCLVLFFFKYFNFFNSNFIALAEFFHLNYPIPLLNIILPIGLSFHTFQSLSYVIEVYRGNQKTERHFGIYSLYVMFYPQLVAGPIERPQNLLHQFYEKHRFDYERVFDGIKLMLWGFFKKIVIADRLAIVVNQIYSDPQQYEGVHLIVATFFFTFQIYCDFSGYSDIAIGSAKVMGFDLMANFKKPYLFLSSGKDGIFPFPHGLKIIYIFPWVVIELKNGDGVSICL